MSRRIGIWIRGTEWVEGSGMGDPYYGYYYKCSECGKLEKGGYKNCGKAFCSRCGLRMEEEREVIKNG